MRWLRVTVALGFVLGVVGCGSDESQVLQLQGFTGENISQADFAGPTSADVDVCQLVCIADEDVEAEPFSQTRVDAVFVNRGKADISLDTYRIGFPPEAGVADVEGNLSAVVIGGRCSSDPQRKCAVDAECAGGQCVHQETIVQGILLYDFTLKDLIKDGQCPVVGIVGGFLTITPGTIIGRTFDVTILFTGTDETGERFTVSAWYRSTFDEFDACEN